ncbi:MAG TPA: UDP-N-acetylmuramate dehydrogenase [Chitinophagaceae bacterium]|nr:UDP-N-acetylmuramate dehydrogenase [Chitinophagaceae bacterium]
MQIQENISLKGYNTFGMDVKARYYSTFSSSDELQTINYKPQTFILGGGSNILFTKDYDGLVLKNEIKGIEELHEDNEYVYVKAGAGENWHQFVMYCINHNWAGVENLSLIPGNAGAAPIQNIGAYGVELKEVFYDLEAFHLEEKKVHRFTLNDCEFGYRDSIFKKKHKNDFVILNVTFRLKKHPVFNCSYGALEQELGKMGVKKLSLKAISQAVINIRTSKLPDPEKIANAGSFFKNPVISQDIFSKLHAQYPAIPNYPQPDGNIKLAAGWLIEQCGPKNAVSWKGYHKGDAGCHEKQALVLVNYGNANGKEIYDLSEEILQSVKEKFAVTLVREVNII